MGKNLIFDTSAILLCLRKSSSPIAGKVAADIISHDKLVFKKQLSYYNWKNYYIIRDDKYSLYYGSLLIATSKRSKKLFGKLVNEVAFNPEAISEKALQWIDGIKHEFHLEYRSEYQIEKIQLLKQYCVNTIVETTIVDFKFGKRTPHERPSGLSCRKLYTDIMNSNIACKYFYFKYPSLDLDLSMYPHIAGVIGINWFRTMILPREHNILLITHLDTLDNMQFARRNNILFFTTATSTKLQVNTEHPLFCHVDEIVDDSLDGLLELLECILAIVKLATR